MQEIESKIQDMLYNSATNIKDYMPSSENLNFACIPTQFLLQLSSDLHALFVQSQIDMLEGLLGTSVRLSHNFSCVDTQYILDRITSLKQLL